MSDVLRIVIFMHRTLGFNTGVWQGIYKYASRHDQWHLIHVPADDTQFYKVINSKPDGVITGKGLFYRLHELNVPCINVGTGLLDNSMAQVLNDDLKIGDLAANYYLERGFRQFAYIGVGGSNVQGRWQGYQNRLQTAGYQPIQLEDITQVMGKIWKDRNSFLIQWLRSLPTPIGIFTFNDEVAEEVLTAARDAGLRVPSEIAVMGVDNDEDLCSVSRPALSSVQVASERIGLEAAQLMQKLIDGAPIPDSPILIPPLGVVTRQSSDFIAVDDPDVEAALTYIYRNITQDIHIDDVSRATKIGRRRLEQKFKAVIGKSPLAMIKQARLERAKQLLVETNFSITLIAKRCGFSDDGQLRATFHQEVGLSPTQYREQSR